MNLKAILKSFLIHTCIYNTVAYSAVMLFFAVFSDEVLTMPFAVFTYFLIFGLCAFFALANVLFAKLTISVWWRALIHAVLSLGGFYLCIFRRYSEIGTPDETLTVFAVLVTLLYAAGFGGFLAVRYVLIRKKEKKEYEAKFSNTSASQKRR